MPTLFASVKPKRCRRRETLDPAEAAQQRAEPRGGRRTGGDQREDAGMGDGDVRTPWAICCRYSCQEPGSSWVIVFWYSSFITYSTTPSSLVLPAGDVAVEGHRLHAELATQPAHGQPRPSSSMRRTASRRIWSRPSRRRCGPGRPVGRAGTSEGRHRPRGSSEARRPDPRSSPLALRHAFRSKQADLTPLGWCLHRKPCALPWAMAYPRRHVMAKIIVQVPFSGTVQEDRLWVVSVTSSRARLTS